MLPVFWISSVNWPDSPRFIVAGPDFVSVSSGAAMVMGSVTPHSPGSGS